MILITSFFNDSTLRIAPKLLGKFLVRKIGKRRIEGIITEVEAYVGPYDRASHASRGKTPRTEVMFGKPGYWYVYLVYGMHHCLNIITEREGYPAAILIRSVGVEADPRGSIRGFTQMITGPGRVCKYFKIDKRFNKMSANKKSGLWIEDRGIRISARDIKRGKRIGVDYAGKWRNKPWRFFFANV
ncbi:MAG: DNA-3-methyladenine glycosylase [Candidatus Sungbacteria bacterium]|nr:DNA-3-methyladenine glycosylase [Candidatus Sungbacteria bacterium]